MVKTDSDKNSEKWKKRSNKSNVKNDNTGRGND